MQRYFLLLVICFFFTVPAPHLDAKQDYAKFQIEKNPIQLQGTVRRGVFCEAIGQKAALLGSEEGIFESWVFPFKILHNLNFSILLEGQSEPFPLSDIAKRIIVRPEATTIIYSHPSFTIQQHLITPISNAGSIILFEIDTDDPFKLFTNFLPDLKPMWPAGLGGQFSYWDDGIHAYIISESQWKYSGAIGCPFGKKLSAPPAHQLSTRPVQFAVDVQPEFARCHFYPFAIAGSVVKGLDDLKSIYANLLENSQILYHRNVEHYENLRTKLLSIKTPSQKVNLALEWAKVSLDKGFIENSHLGRGLVAGYGLSGVGNRPGFAWFFGGDGFLNSMAINAYGNHQQVREALAFLLKYQRDDGKIMHELSQGDGIIDWFSQYHFGFMHGETTPFLIVQMEDYLRSSGDIAFLHDHWDAVLKAYKWCLICDTDGDGLIENSKAGLGASEVGSLRQNIKSDIYLAGVWVKALGSMVNLCEIMGEEKTAKDAEKRYQKALYSLHNKFWNNEKKIINFAMSKDGVNDEITAWAAVPMIYSLFPPAQGDAMVDRFISPGLSTDWGVRMLSSESEAYHPLAYNNGAVWPFLSGLVTLAEYRYLRADAGFFHIQALSNLFFKNALGYPTELLSGNRFRALDTSVPHQLFSSSQFYNAFIRGLLGLEKNALQKEIRFAPQLPAGWGRIEINHFIVGNDTFQINMIKNDKLGIDISSTSSEYKIILSIPLSPGSKISEATLNGKKIDYQILQKNGVPVVQLKFALEKRSGIELKYTGGLQVEEPNVDPEIGDLSAALRIKKHRFVKDHHKIQVIGRAGQRYILKFRTEDKISRIEGAKQVSPNTLQIDFKDGEEAGFKETTVKIWMQ